MKFFDKLLDYAKRNFSKTVYSGIGNEFVTISPFLISCDCDDCRETRYSSGGLFCCCKHLTEYYFFHHKYIPDSLEPYKELIFAFACDGKAIPYEGEFSGYGLIDNIPYLFTSHGCKRPWVRVYLGRAEQYKLNTETGEWDNDNTPYPSTQAEKLEALLLRKAKSYGYVKKSDNVQRQ